MLYQQLYQQSISHPDTFWEEQASQWISWFEPWTQVRTGDFTTLDIQWFKNGKLNACYNCVDRHLSTRRHQPAIIWEGNSPDETQTLTYQQLHEKICRLANVLKNQGVKKGDRVGIYLPMIPEAAIAMLACARIGAIHSVVFAGFSPEALTSRLLDADCRLLITADESLRGEKTIPLKSNCDQARLHCPSLKTIIVVKRTGGNISWNAPHDIWYHEAIEAADPDCPLESMDSNDPLFILYTSGSTGKAKGVVHSTGGYLVYAAVTHRYVFDYQEHDIYWCTADVGWITGHSYLVYGPLANGTTTLIYEGIPNYPDYSRYWSIIDRHQVNVFYTAPTAIRALRQEGDRWVTQTSRKSLRILGSVGEPINPDVWQWYYDVVGEKRCPIMNTWWQTETGGIMITPLLYSTPMAAGSAEAPFFGIVADIVDQHGHSLPDGESGQLVIRQPWPGLMQTIYRDHARFISTYFKDIPGCYLTGDGAYRDAKGQYWITGRNDDVIKVSGHRIGTEELESAFISHPSIAEAAVVGIPHAIKGESIYAFITLKTAIEPTDGLKKELIQTVRNRIGALATPETIQWTTALPKTRSGKIMRRILRKIASHDIENLGDISTLADAEVITNLIKDAS